jgi:mitogen-activated protein kinase kinase kinase 3
LIGEGAFGKVYKYFNKENGNIYAVKELNFEILNKKINNVDNVIKTEINLLSKMKHSNIVKYYGSFSNAKKLNIVLEYCRGGSLLALLKIFNSFDENIIRKYITQILDGLEYLHCHNIIHRDIKCANILIDKNGICKLTDFGGAKIMKEEMTILSSMQGTPNWMAPEIIKSLGATRYSDIWSIGCTVIEMFQGSPPYSEKKNVLSILNCICKNNEPPKIPEGMSEQLKDFVEKCLVFEPTKRFNVYQLKRHPFLSNSKSISNIETTLNNSFYS